jgi:hypothetical protein
LTTFLASVGFAVPVNTIMSPLATVGIPYSL